MNSSTKRLNFSFDWNAIVMVVLGFWLSASFALDVIVVPVLSSTGMMADTGFISAGYVLFGVFNRIELVCAATVLAAFFAFRFDERFGDRQSTNSLIIASGLLNIALIYTYLITPQISGWGLEMEAISTLQTMPTAMVWWHGLYWGLEVVKFVLGFTLLRWCYQRSCSID